MKIEPLSFKHKSILKSRLSHLHLILSEYSFTTLFLFQSKYDFHVILNEDEVWIKGKTIDGYFFLMPTEDLRKYSSEELKEKLQAFECDCFYPIPEKWLSYFDSTFYRDYKRSDSDYLFKRSKIAEYPGRNLSSKRNLLKQFLELYKPFVIKYSKDRIQDAIAILDQWQAASPDEITDYTFCLQALNFYEELDLCGLIIYVEKRPIAFILGEVLDKHLFDVHFVKGLKEYKGIYVYLFKELATQLSCIDVRCLNWEQDLGKMGLRQSKLSYEPDFIAHKYRVFLHPQKGNLQQ